MEKRRGRSSQGVTIREVAARAGVSPMTVSRVINNENNVTPATSAAVMAAIQELKYTPNPAARRLAGSETFRIGLLYSNPSVAFLSEFLLGALDESSKTGHQLVVEKCGATAATEKAALQKLLQSGVDGIVLPPPLCEAKSILADIAKSGVAAVAVAAGQPGPDVATVRIDNYKAAHRMTQHLLSLGHRAIGFIKGHPNQTVSDQRLHGFLDALSEAGLDPKAAPVEQGYFNYRSGLAAADKLLALKQRPTAIFAANDDMAAAVLATAHRLGLSVPVDLSIAGFDDTLIAGTIWPALTTVRQPIAAMGRAAVSMLLDEMKRRRGGGGGAPAQQLLRHTLVERESTAAPSKP
ncbi:LacI family DNA-binding transcriptional regulator [Nitrospirillum sp. BR 11828]|uniref:LacI family DNA-binding transcriptional regulator n=1 Tax=Nitrospirillum sp. BR 11828 TaxID=3104325 RepID=UPI002ACA96DE|nr:LacI family DNA-binding transcriptional regulator [Nitrospirillum sp. BR 11828]MDZ5648351.1 LacI family DNA-binding transcriptional regulator [Nitrospirillum sp. BR 11828]